MEKLLKDAEDLLSPVVGQLSRPASFRVDGIVTVDTLIPAAKALTDAHWGYLSAITGLDKPAPAPAEGEKPGENHMEILYQFCNGPAVTTLRLTIPYSKLTIPTVCNVLPMATLYEREIIEMFGITIEDTPNTDKLLLPDDWPANVYPLRKEFTGFAAKPVAGEGV
ncbi:MAG TPA: NADH-quinone oxidoreductase subunit C [Leptolinea sp.]